jgi:hypothetical protein
MGPNQVAFNRQHAQQGYNRDLSSVQELGRSVERRWLHSTQMASSKGTALGAVTQPLFVGLISAQDRSGVFRAA